MEFSPSSCLSFSLLPSLLYIISSRSNMTGINQFQIMSNTSGEESQNTPRQQLQMGVCMPVSSKGDTSAPVTKKRRNLPGNPDPDAEVIALSPGTLLATNRYICEVCHKGFQRDQNLQLHRRGHNLPWKLKQRSSAEAKKKVYVCPEVSCTHHDPSRALGDLTGIKKHYSRKHGEKKWKCDKCSKRYAVQSDWKAHSKICGTKEYRCDCGTVFSRKDSFVTHRAFCDALTEENYRINHGLAAMVGSLHSQAQDMFSHSMPSLHSSTTDAITNPSSSGQNSNNPLSSLSLNPLIPGSSDVLFNQSTTRTSCLQLTGSGSNSHHVSVGSSFMSATALLQKAAEMGAKVSDDSISPILLRGFTGYAATSRALGSRMEPFSGHGDASSQRLDSSMETSPVGNLGLMSTTSGGSYVENQSALQTNSKWTASGFRPAACPQSGLINLSLPMRADNQNSMVVLEGQMQQNTCEETAGNREARMTQDFLGLGPLGDVGIGNPSYNESAVVLNYSDGQQQSGHGVYPYHQMSDSSTALEKSVWDF